MLDENQVTQEINLLGREVDDLRIKNTFRLGSSVVELDRNIKLKTSGVYWISTSMPVEHLEVLTKKERRSTPPEGKGFIDFTDSDRCKIVYSGTQKDINARIKEHLYGGGSKETGKLECDLKQSDFYNDHIWKVSYCYIQNTQLRYAIESWWRINIGWPMMCKR